MRVIAIELPGKLGREDVSLLDSGLRTAGVDRAQVYITNVCKVLPETADGKIRAPSASEVEAWKPILEREIEATSPAAILALGRTAVAALTGVGAADAGVRHHDRS